MLWLVWIGDLAQRIPTAFWGIVVGSFFSLSGVVLTNRASERRLRSQFLHEREHRNSDRELAVRKDVYLAAVDAVFAGFTVLGKFSNLEVSQNKITEEYTSRAPAIGKVHIVAREETTKAVVSVVRELSTAILRLTVMRFPLQTQRQRLALLDAQISAFGKERDRWVELMRQYNLDGTTDQRRWQTIEDNFNFEQKRVSDAIAERVNVASNLYTQQLELAKEGISESLRLAELIIPAVIAIRNELGIPTDSHTFTKLFEESIGKQREALAGFFESAKRFLE